MLKRIMSILFITVSLSIFLTSCEKPPKVYGAGFTNPEEKPLGLFDLLLSKNRYEHVGHTVKVKAQMQAVDKQKGYYFRLQDRFGILFVDLEKGKKFTVPTDSDGKIAIVEGKFMYDMDTATRGWKLIGDTVEIYEK